MSLLGTSAYANPTTPLWAAAGSGGSNDPNPTFESVTAQDITMWNPGNLFFYNDASGTAFSVMGIGDTTFSSSNVVIQKQDGNGATVALGAVQVSGAGNAVDSASLVVLDASGLTRQNASGGTATFISLDPSSNEMNLSNVTTINGAAYPPAVADVPVIKTGVLNFNAPTGSVTFSTPFSARPTITLQPTTLPPWSGGVEGSGLFYIVSADANGFVVGFSGNIAFFDPMPLMWMALGS
jgi:hypothetical protein